MDLDERKYGPLAMRTQLLAATSCLLQAYSMFAKLQGYLPPDKAVEFQEEMKTYQRLMEELVASLRGDHG